MKQPLHQAPHRVLFFLPATPTPAPERLGVRGVARISSRCASALATPKRAKGERPQKGGNSAPKKKRAQGAGDRDQVHEGVQCKGPKPRLPARGCKNPGAVEGRRAGRCARSHARRRSRAGPAAGWPSSGRCASCRNRRAPPPAPGSACRRAPPAATMARKPSWLAVMRAAKLGANIRLRAASPLERLRPCRRASPSG